MVVSNTRGWEYTHASRKTLVSSRRWTPGSGEHVWRAPLSFNCSAWFKNMSMVCVYFNSVVRIVDGNLNESVCDNGWIYTKLAAGYTVDQITGSKCVLKFMMGM